jgi:anthranilate phosphoribosyltransferase
LTPLDEEAATAAFAAIFDGRVADDRLATFLTGLADRGETVTEIVAAAQMLRQRQSFAPQAPDAIDVCGTGGDGKHSLNVSTAVALTVAACGIKVAKHGNRAASSSSGAADVLAALGVPELPVERLGACLDEVGITFLHAARHHPAMAHVAPVRRALGRRTIFNLLGPLVNPAGVRRQLVGVFAADRVTMVGEALLRLGATRAMIVHGDGYDEIAVTGTSDFALVGDGVVTAGRLDASIIGAGNHPAAALSGGDAAHNASRLRAVLTGETGAYHDIVVINAAAALRLVEPALRWPDAADRARAALASGAAADVLDRWRAFR